MSSMKMTIKYEKRLCKVDEKLCYFHMWENYSQPVKASMLIGGSPAGIISFVSGIVEYPDGSIKKVTPTSIVFVDEESEMLKDLNYKKINKKV